MIAPARGFNRLGHEIERERMTMVVRNLAGGDLDDHDGRADRVGGALFSTGTTEHHGPLPNGIERKAVR
jgi:hypothetical protein